MSNAKKNARSASLGGFAGGLIIGLLLGLALALGVALYIAKVPIPFVDKLPQRTAEQDKAEAERNKTWDPNAALTPNPQPLPASASAAPATPATPTTPATAAGKSLGSTQVTTTTTPTAAAVPASAAAASTRDPAAILADDAKSTDAASAAFTYLVQVGAFTRAQDAEARRAALAMQGFTAKVQEREQAGRTVYRVRLGPFDTKAEADALQLKLQGAGIDGQLVRIQKP